jgi:hypothetical protein
VTARSIAAMAVRADFGSRGAFAARGGSVDRPVRCDNRGGGDMSDVLISSGLFWVG